MTTRHDKERQRAAQEKYQAVLSQLLKDEDNKYCVDCDAKGPRWASWNLGIFLCIRCAGIHRNLGVHISKVKSVNLDTWTAEQLAMLMEMGNSRARAVYEANLPDNFRRPQTDSSALEAFIRAKYEHKRYIAREWVQPKPSVPRQLLEDEQKDKKKTRPRPSSMIQLNAPSQKQEAKEPETTQPLKEVAKETKKTSHADDLLNLSSPGDSGGGTTNTSLLDDFLGASGTPTANATPPPAQNQSNGQTSTATSTASQQTFQQNGAFDDSLFTSAGADAKTSDKTTKESIMALYGSSNQQQGMYGVPGGQTSSMMNSIAGTMPQSIYMNQQGLLYMAPSQQMQTDASSMYKFVYTDNNNTAGGMYMPAQALNMQAVPPTNPMAVQQGMPGMVPQGMMVMQQGGMYQMAGGGMMPAGAVANPMAAGAPAGMMMQQPQVGMFATASPPQPQMNMQQMQQQMAAMRMNAPGTIAPGGQMGIRPQAGAPAATPTNPWGMPATSGQTLSTNLWQ